MYKNEIINETNDIETEKYKTMDSVYKTQSYFFEVVYEVDKTFGKSDQEKCKYTLEKRERTDSEEIEKKMIMSLTLK